MLGEMRGRKYQGNVKEAIVSMQKRFSYNPTFTREISVKTVFGDQLNGLGTS